MATQYFNSTNKDLHAQETTLVTQLTDLLEAVEAEQEESERSQLLKVAWLN